ncbi:hypothetical protein STURON_00928 [Spiroplasma turonicum]|uniref:Uncharacterized protein n=1 Tax=Spiroplasma turonicum TaxID=216946 RepID=A0A0K1P7K9_9MOLU|nr:hypothetical protein STURON_00928 [Spiroplasma turonicum]
MATVGISSTVPSFVLSCNSDDKTTKSNLNNIKYKELGDFLGEGDKPTLVELLSKINSINETDIYNVNDISFDGEPTVTEAKIKANEDSKSFIGSVVVTYKYYKRVDDSLKTDLSKVAIKEFGYIYDSEPSFTKDIILKNFNLINVNNKITWDDVNIRYASDESAEIIIKETSSKYKGESFEVSFIFEQTQDLENYFRNTDLGIINDKESLPTIDILLRAINKQVRGREIFKEDINIDNENFSETSIRILPSSNNRFIGSIKLTYNYTKTWFEMEIDKEDNEYLSLENDNLKVNCMKGNQKYEYKFNLIMKGEYSNFDGWPEIGNSEYEYEKYFYCNKAEGESFGQSSYKWIIVAKQNTIEPIKLTIKYGTYYKSLNVSISNFG